MALVMASLNGVHVPKLFSPRTVAVKVVGTVCSGRLKLNHQISPSVHRYRTRLSQTQNLHLHTTQVASGLPVGPEGPLVHVGAAVASFFTRRHRWMSRPPKSRRVRAWKFLDTFFNDIDGRDFLSAGVASGLAAAFGAPIGGVLFSLEEASTHWSHTTTWR